MDKPGPMTFENGQALIFYRQGHNYFFYKISYKDFTKTLILVSRLSFKNSNP